MYTAVGIYAEVLEQLASSPIIIITIIICSSSRSSSYCSSSNSMKIILFIQMHINQYVAHVFSSY